MSTLVPPWTNINGEFFIEAPQNKFMKAKNGSITTIKLELNSDPIEHLHFYIERSAINTSPLVYRFRPVKYQTKYVAVSGNNIVLENSSDITNNSNCFVVHAINDDYQRYQTFSSAISTEKKKMFMTADENGNVTITEDENGNGTNNVVSYKTWFKPVSLGNISIFAFTARLSKKITPKEVVDTVIFNEKQVNFGIPENYVLQKIELFEKILERERDLTCPCLP